MRAKREKLDVICIGDKCFVNLKPTYSPEHDSLIECAGYPSNDGMMVELVTNPKEDANFEEYVQAYKKLCEREVQIFQIEAGCEDVMGQLEYLFSESKRRLAGKIESVKERDSKEEYIEELLQSQIDISNALYNEGKKSIEQIFQNLKEWMFGKEES